MATKSPFVNAVGVSLSVFTSNFLRAIDSSLLDVSQYVRRSSFDLANLRIASPAIKIRMRLKEKRNSIVMMCGKITEYFQLLYVAFLLKIVQHCRFGTWQKTENRDNEKFQLLRGSGFL